MKRLKIEINILKSLKIDFLLISASLEKTSILTDGQYTFFLKKAIPLPVV